MICGATPTLKPAMIRKLADKPTPYANEASPWIGLPPIGVVSLPSPIGRKARPIRHREGGDGGGAAGNGSTTIGVGAGTAGTGTMIAAGGGAAGVLSSARAPAPSATNVRPIRVLVSRICFLSLIWSPLEVEGESKTNAVHLVVVRRCRDGAGL